MRSGGSRRTGWRRCRSAASGSARRASRRPQRTRIAVTTVFGKRSPALSCTCSVPSRKTYGTADHPAAGPVRVTTWLSRVLQMRRFSLLLIPVPSGAGERCSIGPSGRSLRSVPLARPMSSDPARTPRGPPHGAARTAARGASPGDVAAETARSPPAKSRNCVASRRRGTRCGPAWAPVRRAVGSWRWRWTAAAGATPAGRCGHVGSTWRA